MREALADRRARWFRGAMTPRLSLALALCAPALPAPAQGWEAPPLAALTGDWNGDGLTDLAILTPGAAGTADLILYHGGPQGMTRALVLRGAVFAGPMAGQTPSLAARSATSFAILSEQIGIGRSPWEQAVTVAWRRGGHVVAGFTHAFFDRLDPERQGRCDVNLLTGGWEAAFSPGTGQPPRQASGRDGPRAFPLADLTEDFLPAPCLALLGD